MPVRGIGDEHRNAVGHPHGHGDATPHRDEGVPLFGAQPFGGLTGVGHPHQSPVDLAQLVEGGGRIAHGGGEGGVVLLDRLGGVADGAGEVEGVVGGCAHAAGAQGEAMGKAVLGEQLGAKDVGHGTLLAACAARCKGAALQIGSARSEALTG